MIAFSSFRWSLPILLYAIPSTQDQKAEVHHYVPVSAAISCFFSGPGFYFSSSYGAAREYNSAVLKADCRGKCAHVDGPYFDRITDAGVTSNIAHFIGLKANGYGTARYEHDVARRVLYEYTRNMIVDELGYDMAYGSSRFDSCYAVYNPKAISNIRFD